MTEILFEIRKTAQRRKQIASELKDSSYSEDISDVTSSVMQYLWLTENSRTSNDCRFTYMLDFMLKPGGKLEYQNNASLLQFKGNPSIDTCRKSHWNFFPC